MAYEVLKDETKRKAAWARRALAKVEMIGDSLQLTVHDEDGTTGRPLAHFKASSDLYDCLKAIVGYLDSGALKMEWTDGTSGPVNLDGAKAAIAKAEGRKASRRMGAPSPPLAPYESGDELCGDDEEDPADEWESEVARREAAHSEQLDVEEDERNAEA